MFIIIDQVTKAFVVKNLKGKGLIRKGPLKLSYVENKGAALGFMRNHVTLLKAFNIFVIGLVTYLYFDKTLSGLAFIFIVSGGIGNTLDRFTRGYVVDFFSTKKLPYFNIADMYVFIGLAILIVQEIKGFA